MSYDIWLTIDTGGGESPCVFDVGNYTSNVSDVWTKALGFPLHDLNDRMAGECIEPLTRAVLSMNDPANEADYQAMNPSNRWGSFEGAREYLEKLLEGCKRHPKTRVHIWF
jgi:hypothetical protein